MALYDPQLWAINGAPATLRSYGGKISADHARWMAGLGEYHREGKWFFVHAGIDPEVALAEQDRRTMLWIRGSFLGHGAPFDDGVVVVHGHTPVERPEIEPNRINVDTGAVYGGRLTCAVLTDRLEGFLQV